MTGRIFYFIISALFISQCSTLPDKGSGFYTEEERAVLEKTVEALDYGYGYDSEMDLHYVYAYSYSESNFDKKIKKFSDIAGEVDAGTLLSLYDKMVRLKAKTDYKMNRYREKYEWRYYTFIKKDLYDPLESYTGLLRKSLLRRVPSLGDKLQEREYAMKKEVVESFVKEEEIIDTF